MSTKQTIVLSKEADKFMPRYYLDEHNKKTCSGMAKGRDWAGSNLAK